MRLKVESDEAEDGLIRAAKPALVRVQAYGFDFVFRSADIRDAV
jgi:hypothetical protein